MSVASLTIRRLRVEALLPAGYPDSERVRRRLADAAKHAFARALGRALSQWDTDQVLLIHRLHVESCLDLALSDEAMAQGLAAAIAREIVRLGDDPDENVVIFPDRAAHLAAFLAALSEDGARDRWWFRAFDGVRVLPKPMAIRTLLLADASEGAQALARLPVQKRLRVIIALGEEGAVRVGDGLAAAAGGTPDLGAAILALAAAGRADRGDADLAPCAKALELYLHAIVSAPALAGRPLFAAATALAQLRAGLRDLDRNRSAALMRAIRGGYAPAPLPSAEPLRRAVALLLPLAAAERRTAVKFAGAAQRHGPAGAAADSCAADAFTRFGGLFLLLPSLVELPITGEAAAWPQPPGCRAEDVLSLMVLAACAGRRRAAAVLTDPLWRDLLRLPPTLDADAVSAWLAGLPRSVRAGLAKSRTGGLSRSDALHLGLPAACCRSRRARRRLAAIGHAVLRGFARRLPGFANSSAGFLWRNFLAVGARVELETDAIRVFTARPALDVVLTMAGLRRAAFTLRDGRSVVIERVE